MYHSPYVAIIFGGHTALSDLPIFFFGLNRINLHEVLKFFLETPFLYYVNLDWISNFMKPPISVMERLIIGLKT